MVIIGQELCGFTIVAALDLPSAADAYRAIDAEENEVTLYLKKEDGDLAAGELDGEVEQLRLLSRSTGGAVPVVAGGVLGDTAWLATSATPATGATRLESVLARFRPLAFEITAGVARVLRGAHALGLVHGDLGPHNVLITEDGVTTLEAFGFYRVFGAPCDEVAEAARYRAPELFDGRAIDIRTDVYGLGMLLYSLLAGRAPTDGREREEEDDEDSPQGAPRDAPEPLTGMPDPVNAALARALAAEPDARFQTVDDFVAALFPRAPTPIRSDDRASPGSQPPPDTMRTAPPPSSRDTLPAGTLAPEAVRHPAVLVVEPRRRQQRMYLVGALIAAALASSGATWVLAPRSPAPAGREAAAPARRATPLRLVAARRAPGVGSDDPAAASPASQRTGQAPIALPKPTPSPAPVVNRQVAAPPSTDEPPHEDVWYSAHY